MYKNEGTNLYEFFKKNRFFIILIFYGIGASGCLIGQSKILKLSALNLIVTLVLTIINFPISKKNLLILIFLYILSFTVEWIGTTTGFPFGEYSYGNSLGPLFMDVPIIIGLNWIIVSLSAKAISSLIFKPIKNTILQVIVSSFLMLHIDWLIEPICEYADFWYWKNMHAPVENYISWWIIGLIFQTMVSKLDWNFETERFLAKLYIVNTVFFIVLNLSKIIWN